MLLAHLVTSFLENSGSQNFHSLLSEKYSSMYCYKSNLFYEFYLLQEEPYKTTQQEQNNETYIYVNM